MTSASSPSRKHDKPRARTALERLFDLPLILALMTVAAASMYIPAIFAAVMLDWVSARIFFYSGTISLVLTALIGLAKANQAKSSVNLTPLIDVLAAYTVLPIMLAIPVWEIVPGISFIDSYFEMVSSLTTTGATIFDGVQTAPEAVHLWRALVGWLGGFLMWFIAIAVLAPLSLGGFEVMGRSLKTSASVGNFNQIADTADTSARLRYYAAVLAPVYGGLTLVLWVVLYLLGDNGLVAISHAMSTMATSGISPINGTQTAESGLGGEIIILIFLVFGLSRRTFTRDSTDTGMRRLSKDPELRLGLFFACSVPALLFLRHWVGALDETSPNAFEQGLLALWGGFFTTVSFLTTTGFVSSGWSTARDWSGLETPGLIFMGLALIGGGVATTAGGVKLLRVHVLYSHGQREIDKLVYPNSVGNAAGELRKSRRQGTFMAWIFFMLFALSIAGVMLALSLTGIEFEDSVVLTIAALSTTGPLVGVIGVESILYSTLGSAAKLILAASMVLGRLETLAIISLLNPEIWRK